MLCARYVPPLLLLAVAAPLRAASWWSSLVGALGLALVAPMPMTVRAGHRLQLGIAGIVTVYTHACKQTFALAERFRLNHRAALLLRQASLTVSLPLMAMVVVTAPMSATLLSRAALAAAAVLLGGAVAARLAASPGNRVRMTLRVSSGDAAAAQALLAMSAPDTTPTAVQRRQQELATLLDAPTEVWRDVRFDVVSATQVCACAGAAAGWW